MPRVLNTLPYYAKKQMPNMGSHFICRCTHLLICIFKFTETFSFIDTLGGVGTKVGGVGTKGGGVGTKVGGGGTKVGGGETKGLARVEEVILGAFQTHIQFNLTVMQSIIHNKHCIIIKA